MAYLGRTPIIGRYVKIDDIGSSFNGSLTTFNLTSGGDAVVVQAETQIIVSLAGAIKEPITDYTVSGSQITFASAPANGVAFFATVLGDTHNVGVPLANTLENTHIKSDAAIAMSKLDGSSGSLSALTVTGDITLGDDLYLDSDSSVIHFGDDGDVTLTHVADTGLRLNDNMKMMFGTGNDLQIRHDGSNSFIDDTGTGGLYIRADNIIRFDKYTGEIIAAFNADGAVDLYHNNAKKFETSASGVTITSHLAFSGANPGILGSDTDGRLGIHSDASASAGSEILLYGSAHGSVPHVIRFRNNNSDSVTINATGLVGIGTTAPDSVLHVYGVGGTSALRLQRVDSGNPSASSNWQIKPYAAGLDFREGTTDRVHFKSGGHVGIGVYTPTTFSGYTTVHHKNAAGDAIHLIESDGGIISQTIVNDASSAVTHGARSNHAYRLTTNDTERLRILTDGKVGIGVTAPLADLHIRHDSGSTNQLLLTYSTTDHLGFIAGGSGCGLTVTSDNFFTINHQPAADRGGESNLTERMRITSAGDVGIGATPSYAKLQITGGAGSLPSETASGETILQVQNNAGATDTARVSIISGTSGQSNLDFGDSGDENMGSVYYSNATNLMGLRTSGSGVDLVIDSAGKVGIGTTTFANGGSFEVVTGATGVIASFEGASADTLYAWNRAAGIVGFTTNSADTFEIKSNTTQFIDQSNASIATFTTATSTFAGDVAINGADLYVGNSSSLPSNSDIYMYGATDGTGHIFFNDGANAGGIEYNHATNAFTLGTNGDTAAVTINSSQKVGIGTTSPQAPLHVVQTAGTLPGSSTNGVVIQKNAATTDIAVISLIGGAAADSRVEFGDAADRDIGMIRYTHSDNAMEFWTNTGERMTITSAGLVGIGVTGPDAKLNVYQATVGGTGYQNGIRLNTPNIDSRWFEGGGTDMGIGTHSNHGFNLRTNNSAKLSITAAGNVGIGSTTANALLHLTSGTDQKLILSGSGSPNINLNSSTGDDFLVQNHAGSFRIYNLTDSRQDFAIDGAGNAVFGGTDTRFPWANDGYARMYYDASYHMGMHFEADTRDLVLYTKSGDNAGDIRFKTGTNATERMVVTADGLVGIGTTSVYANSVLEISSATNALPTTTTTSDSHVAGWRTRRTGGSHAHEWYAGMRENDKAFQLFDNTNNACRLHINTDGHPTFYGQMQIHHNVPFIKLKDNTTSGGTFQSYLVGEDSAGTIRWRFGRYDGGHDDVEITNVSGSDIKFLTNNTEKMRILSDGKVGIGTSSPVATLHVGASSNQTFGGNHGMYANSRVGITNHGSLTGLMLASTYNDANYPEYGLVFVQGPSTSSYNVWSISPDGPAKGDSLNFLYGAQATNIHTATPKVVFDGNGNVGIGTASPDEKLEVWGNAKIGDTTTAYLTLGDDLSTGSAKLEIGTGRSGSGYSYIDLVGDTTYTDYGLRIIRDNSGANAPTTINHRGTGTFTIKSTEAADILFQTTNASRMTIASGGNVGIGTTTPAQKLDVVGNIQASGKTYSPILEGAGGVTYDPPGSGGTDVASDVAIALHSGTRMVMGYSGYIRNLIDAEWQQPLKIGQSGTVAIAGTEIYGGSQGVTLKFNTDTKFQTTTNGVTASGDLTLTGGAVLGSSTLSADGQNDIFLFSTGPTTGTAQSGAYHNKLRLLGGSSQTRDFQLYQVDSGYATIDSNWTSNQLTIGSAFTQVNFQQDIIPSAHNTYSLGSEAKYFDNAYSHHYWSDAVSDRLKFGVWDEGAVYAMGMGSGYSLGALNDYAMTFQMNSDADRGFWWGTSSHSNAQGAMSLTTGGHLYVAGSVRLGDGTSFTSGTVSPTYKLDVNGSINIGDGNARLSIHADATDAEINYINNASMVFKTNNTEIARFDAYGKLAINSSSHSAFLHVNGDYNSRAVHSTSTQTTVDSTQYHHLIDHNTTFSGTTVPTGNRISYGLYIDSDFSGTFAGTTTNGERFYNRPFYIHSYSSHSTGTLYENEAMLLQSFAVASGSGKTDRLYGILNYTYDYETTGKTSQISANNGSFKRAEATGTTSYLYGCQNYAYTYAGAGATTNSYGSTNHVAKYDTNTMTTVAGSRNYITGDAGTISNGYGVLSQNYFTGTMTNSYGIYTTGFVKEHLAGNVGIKTTSPSYALHVVGDIYATGNVSAYSSAIAKDNIVTIPNALELVNKLRGVSFDWKESGKKSMGMIYEEVKEVVPELTTSEKGSHGVTYQNTVAILIEAIKELKQEIDELKRNA